MEDRQVGSRDLDLAEGIAWFDGETGQEGDAEVLADHRLDDVDIGGTVENVGTKVGSAAHLFEGLIVEEFGVGDDELFIL